MCSGADSHLEAQRRHYLCCNDEIKRLPSSVCRHGRAPSTEAASLQMTSEEEVVNSECLSHTQREIYCADISH